MLSVSVLISHVHVKNMIIHVCCCGLLETHQLARAGFCKLQAHAGRLPSTSGPKLSACPSGRNLGVCLHSAGNRDDVAKSLTACVSI